MDIKTTFIAKMKQLFHFPHHQKTWRILAISGAISVCLLAIYVPFGLISFFGFLYLYIILRQSHSYIPTDSEGDGKAILAPSDGIICKIDVDAKTGVTQIFIAPDWFDSHLLYPPVGGMIGRIIWYDGAFASHANDGTIPSTNARQQFIFKSEQGTDITIEQYASPVTRFLLSFVQEGETVSQERAFATSLIRPIISISYKSSARPNLQLGQRCLARQTILHV